jgi:hypothetical protein
MRQRELVVTGTGISMMRILPRLGDTGENLQATIRCTAEHRSPQRNTERMPSHL